MGSSISSIKKELENTIQYYGFDSSSNTSIKKETETEKAYKNALKVYQQRLQSYNLYIHGPYHIYLYNVEAQFELDCIPQDAMQGSAVGSKISKFNNYQYYY